MKKTEWTTQENCSRCNGQGKISSWDYSFGGAHWDEKPKQVTCTQCNGSGKVEVHHTYTDHTQGSNSKIEGFLKKTGFFDD